MTKDEFNSRKSTILCILKEMLDSVEYRCNTADLKLAVEYINKLEMEEIH